MKTAFPDMFFRDGDSVLTPAVLQQMLIEFYTAMGWDENGRPLKDNPGGAWHRYPLLVHPERANLNGALRRSTVKENRP
jgi:hypothetical protein